MRISGATSLTPKRAACSIIYRRRFCPCVGPIPGFSGGSGSGRGGQDRLQRVKPWGERVAGVVDRLPQVPGEGADLVIGRVARHNLEI